MSRFRPVSGFTLMEMLVVIAILAVLGGMMTYSFAKPELRRQHVRLAAEELASTMRKARVLAMERKTVHAVVFHIQNDPSGSGLVLNNRSGGHWYRILGPGSTDVGDRTQSVDDLPALGNPGSGMRPHNVAEVEEIMNRAWIEEPHVLAPGQVRFLALSDMDWGDARGANGAYRQASADASYPRPWFGWYDSGSQRLFPWGGYDPAIDGSGFYFWGSDWSKDGISTARKDPQPVGCTNPVDRILDHWIVGQKNGRFDQMVIPDQPASTTLYTAGSPRPLINSEWRDCCLIFLSSGEVRWGNFMATRHGGYLTDGQSVDSVERRRGVHDRCNGTGLGTYRGEISQHTDAEASNFDVTTGGWYITLAPDAKNDNDRFPTAEAALASISPMYRIFVSRLGDVRVIPVERRSDFGTYAPFPNDPAWWNNTANLKKNFPQDGYVDGTKTGSFGQGTGVAQGRPITDFVTPEMLTGRQVWMK